MSVGRSVTLTFGCVGWHALVHDIPRVVGSKMYEGIRKRISICRGCFMTEVCTMTR